MHRQTNNFKMLLMASLVTWAVLLSGCQTGMPKAPQGEFYIHNQPKGVAVCSDIQTTKACDPIEISKTHKFIMFSPTTWESIQNYIDALIRKVRVDADRHYQLMMNGDVDRQVQSSGFYLSASQIQWFKDHIKALETNTLNQRKMQ